MTRRVSLRPSLIAFFLSMLLFTAGAGRAQRATGVAEPSTSCVVSGRIVSDDADRRAIRRALVTITRIDGHAATYVTSDDDGRFESGGLTPGRYSVTAAKPGYVTTHFGSRRPGRGPGVPVVLHGDRCTATLTVPLARGAAIAGTVVDHTRRPQRNAIVSVIDAARVSAGGVVTPVSTASTDDLGEYRIHSLPAGRYLVVVQPGFSFNSAQRMQPGEWESVPREHAARRSSPRFALEPPANGPPVGVGYGPTIYPGTADLSAGTPLVLAAGEERTGIDLQLQFVPSVRLEGRFVDPHGGVPSGLQASLIWPGRALGLSEFSYVGTQPARATTLTTREGQFVRTGLTPGRYTLFARASSAPAATAGREPAMLDLWAMATIDVSDRHLTDVVVQMRSGMRVAGRLTFDAGAGMPPADVARVQVRLVPAPGTGVNLTVRGVPVAADGSFALTGVAPGRYRVALTFPSSAGDGWWVKTALHRGADTLDSDLELQPDDSIDDLMVAVGRRPAIVSGRLIDASGLPVTGYAVVVFSAEREFWTAGSRRTAFTHLGTDGSYRFSGLPPGRYLLAALIDLDPADVDDPAFLEMLAGAAIPIAFGDGEARVVDVKIAGR